MCRSDEFECLNKRCISKTLVCNNVNDCGDEADEDVDMCGMNYSYFSTFYLQLKLSEILWFGNKLCSKFYK